MRYLLSQRGNAFFQRVQVINRQATLFVCANTDTGRVCFTLKNLQEIVFHWDITVTINVDNKHVGKVESSGVIDERVGFWI